MKMVILKQYYYALFLPNNNNVAMDIIISFFNVKNIILLNHNKSFNQYSNKFLDLLQIHHLCLGHYIPLHLEHKNRYIRHK